MTAHRPNPRRRPVAASKADAYAERTRRRAEIQAQANEDASQATREAMCEGCFTVPAASGECLC